MLVLRRRLGEAVWVGDPRVQFRVVVLEAYKGAVKLGIEGPEELRIVREELLHDDNG